MLARLARSAPGIDVHHFRRQNRDNRLVQGEADVLLAPLEFDERAVPGVHAEGLAQDRLVCLIARSHPFARRAPALQRFLHARHALIAPRGEPGGVVDRALAETGLVRRVALTLPHFLAAPFLVAATDLVLTVSERVASRFETLPVVRFEPPLKLPTFTTGFYWHDRDAHDQA